MASEREGLMDSGCVLIADRDPQTAEALASALRRKVIEVEIAASSQEVVELLSRRTFAVAVMDVDVLEGGADNVAAMLDAIPRHARPIVLATMEGSGRANLDPEMVQIVIRKPIRAGELSEIIRACIDSPPDMRGGPAKTRLPQLDLQR